MRLWPRSLLGQMLLAVAAVLLLAQTIWSCAVSRAANGGQNFGRSAGRSDARNAEPNRADN